MINLSVKLLMVLTLLFNIVESNFILFSLTKQLYVPGRKSSSVTINHQLNALTPYIYDINAQFSLSQTTQFNQTNSVFDFFKTTGDYSTLSQCYESSVTYMNSLYEQYQPCEEKCQILDGSERLKINQLNQNIGNQNTESQQLYFIIDNTFYPCSGGVYLPQLYLFQQINLTIETNATFFILIKTACVASLQILILLITYIMIMFNKLHHKKTKLLKLKQEEDNKDILRNFIHSKSRE